MYSFGDFCEGGIWNASLFLDNTWPQLTPCFILLVRIWIPCLYVWLLLPLFIKNLRKLAGKSTGQNTTGYTSTIAMAYQGLHGCENGVEIHFPPVPMMKFVLVFIQVVVWVIEVFRLMVTGSSVMDVLSGFAILASLILLCFMLSYEKKKGCASSSYIFFYFFTMELVFGAFNVYMWIFIWGVKDAVFPFSIVVILYLLNLACLVLTFFGDNPAVSSRKNYQSIDRPESPEMTSPYPSKLFFTWMRSLIITGFRHSLTYDDVWRINPRDASSRLRPVFEALWAEELERVKRKNSKRQAIEKERPDCYQMTNGHLSNGHLSNGHMSNGHMSNGHMSNGYSKNSHEHTPLINGKAPNHNAEVNKTTKVYKEKTKPNLFVVMTKLLWKDVLIGLTKKCVGDTFMFLGPIILGALINFLQNYDENKVWQAYALSVLLLLTGLTKSVLFAHSMFEGSLIGLKFKTVLTTAIYKKALTLSGSARKSATVGEVVNLMSVDCQRLQEMMTLFLYSWSTPFQVLLAIVFLYLYLGVSIFAGVLLMALSVPINYVLLDKQRVHQADILNFKDDRIRLVNEIVNGMKVLKFYAWELEFKKKVEAIRKMEIRSLFKIANLFIVLNTVAGLLPFLVGLVTFVTYMLIDRENVLDAQKAFVSLALLNLLREPMLYVATAIVFSVQSVVCIKRINKFLNLEDLDPSSISHDNTNKYAIQIKSGTFSWDKKRHHTLNDINIEVPEGSLVAVIGPIGCGKSSLISGILGEIHKQRGFVNVKGRVGYVSQQAWIQNATVRENILFGSKYNRRRYNATVKACQLLCDFEILDGGDQTEIGEKGINISGGQKQRVNLARAAYSQSDIYLFDDPLSAVDAHVGKAIFDQLIGPEGMLAGKTRVLVTHGLQWLPKVDKIIVLSNGRITDQGSYNELKGTSKHFSELIRLYSSEANPQPDLVANAVVEFEKISHQQKQAQQPQIDQAERRRSRKLSEPFKLQDSFDIERSRTLVNSVKSVHQEPSKLTMTETLEKGKIGTDVYTTYVKAAGAIILPMAFLCYVIFNACLILSNFWLAEWTKVPILLNESTRTTEEAISTSNHYMLIYGLFGAGQVVMHLLFCILFWYGMVRAGQRLHSLLLERLFHAPMSFFDQTPVGRILNRFSRDVDIVDNNLPLIIENFTVTVFLALGTVIVIMVKTPMFGIVLIPLIICFMIAQSIYVRTSTQLKRMESIARSPVYTHFSETITGASSIRAYGAAGRFITESENRIDENQVYFSASQAANRWLQLNLDVLSNLLVLFAALFQVISGGGGSDAGLSVTYALQITGVMTLMVRQICEFETNIVCVERMKEYSLIEQEAALQISSSRPASKWPEEGNVEFCDYQLRYRPGLQLVLKGVNCSIRKAEKVGIVGRTGAGKSSLTLGLFRIIEAAGGIIQIDGVNIAKIGLHDLRKKLTILPQDPVLFSGSLRMNIDPFDEFTDDKLWLALEHSHLKKFVAGQPDGLMYECGEEGTNLSVGQRQLVCLARALLRKTRILILDEATAAVDLETDALIQATIKKAFHDCTVLAIAHRLQTIMDYDKVIVMDVGVVKEFDSPENLINERGVFYSMCKDAGLV